MKASEVNHIVRNNDFVNRVQNTMIDGIKYSCRTRGSVTKVFKGNRLCSFTRYQNVVDRHPDADCTLSLYYQILDDKVCLVYFNGTLESVTHVYRNKDNCLIIDTTKHFELENK